MNILEKIVLFINKNINHTNMNKKYESKNKKIDKYVVYPLFPTKEIADEFFLSSNQ